MRDALREHLKRLQTVSLEKRDRQGIYKSLGKKREGLRLGSGGPVVGGIARET